MGDTRQPANKPLMNQIKSSDISKILRPQLPYSNSVITAIDNDRPAVLKLMHIRADVLEGRVSHLQLQPLCSNHRRLAHQPSRWLLVQS